MKVIFCLLWSTVRFPPGLRIKTLTPASLAKLARLRVDHLLGKNIFKAAFLDVIDDLRHPSRGHFSVRLYSRQSRLSHPISSGKIAETGMPPQNDLAVPARGKGILIPLIQFAQIGLVRLGIFLIIPGLICNFFRKPERTESTIFRLREKSSQIWGSIFSLWAGEWDSFPSSPWSASIRGSPPAASTTIRFFPERPSAPCRPRVPWKDR